jgi:hypothetical protein
MSGQAAQSPGQPASSDAPPPATGDDAQLGDAGKRALDAERSKVKDATSRADALQRELDDLKAANQSEHEKALTEKTKEAATARDAHWLPLYRGALVREALRAVGMTNDRALAMAANDPVFASVKVNDDGTADDLAKVVEAFRKDAPPELFAVPKAPVPQPTRGLVNGAQASDRPKTPSEIYAGHYASGAKPQ